MSKVSIFVSLLSLLPLVSGCDKVSFPAGDKPAGRSPIVFKAAKGGVSSPDGGTKVSVVSGLDGFYAAACTGVTGSGETNVWNHYVEEESGLYPTGEYWPGAGDYADNEYSFYASNIPMTATGAGYTVSASNTKDVVCAFLESPEYDSENSLSFGHIFARLGTVTVVAESGYTLSGVSVTITPKTGGTYNLYAGDGHSDGTGWSNLTTGSATAIAPSSAGSRSNDLYLVPGDYTLTASWTAAKGGYSKTYSSVTSTVSLRAGMVNTVSTTLGGDAADLSVAVSVSSWYSAYVSLDFPAPEEEIEITFTESSGKYDSFYVSACTGTAGSSETNVWNSQPFTLGALSSYTGGLFWPSTDEGYIFYASNNALAYTGAGYTVRATNSKDVVCAYLPGPAYKETNALTFSHIFSKLGTVTVACQSGTSNYTLTVDQVSIRITPKTGGTYNLYTGYGKTDGTGWSSTTTGSATTIGPTAAGSKSNSLFLVPGSYSISVSWRCVRKSVNGDRWDGTVSNSTTVSATFASGYGYNLSFTLGYSGTPSFSTSRASL